MPFALMTLAASGVRRNFTSACAAAAFFALARIAEVKTVTDWKSERKGDTPLYPPLLE